MQGAIEIDGLQTYCRVDGDGPPALLLHGWGGEGASLHPLTVHLARRYRTITPDLPGFGLSELPPTDWDVPDYAAWARKLAARLGVERTLLLGHSHGGRVSIWLAAHEPDFVERLILVDSAGLRPPDDGRLRTARAVSKAGRAASAVPLLGGVAERLRGRWHRAIGAEDYANAGPLRGTFLKVVNRDLRDLLPRVQAPTLLIWGEDDRSTPLGDGEQMADLIPNARLVSLPGAGHFSYLDRGTDACAAIDRFLAEPGPTR